MNETKYTRFENFKLREDDEIDNNDKVNMGSQDLIMTAGYLYENNYEILFIEASDSNLEPLSAKTSAIVSKEMIYVLETYGCNELQAAMRDDFDGLYVVDLTVKNRRSERIYSVSRNQIIETNIDKNSYSLDSTLTERIYDVELYQIEDHDLVHQVYKMSENDTIDIELTDMNGKNWLENNGDKVVITLTKEEIEEVLIIAQKDDLTFNEVFVKAIQLGINSEK